MIDEDGNVQVGWVKPTHADTATKPGRMSAPFCVCRDCGQPGRCEDMTRDKQDGRRRCARCAQE